MTPSPTTDEIKRLIEIGEGLERAGVKTWLLDVDKTLPVLRAALEQSQCADCKYPDSCKCIEKELAAHGRKVCPHNKTPAEECENCGRHYGSDDLESSPQAGPKAVTPQTVADFLYDESKLQWMTPLYATQIAAALSGRFALLPTSAPAPMDVKWRPKADAPDPCPVCGSSNELPEDQPSPPLPAEIVEVEKRHNYASTEPDLGLFNCTSGELAHSDRATLLRYIKSRAGEVHNV